MVEICPLPGPGYTVTGGPGSVLVEYDALEEQAAKLETAAARMGAVAGQLRRILLAETDLLWQQPHSAAVCAQEELFRAADLVTRSGNKALDCAADVRTAAARYREVEGRTERLNRQGLIPAIGLLWLGRGAGAFPERRVLEELPIRLIDSAVLRAAIAAVSPGSHGLRPVTVEKSERSGDRVRVDGSTVGLLGRSAALLEEDDPGIVEVLRIDRDGESVFVVTLPGTQPGGRTAGDNPFDAFGNAEGRAYQSRYIAAAVAEALRQAQAEAGDAVILVGYSQGGIHAANAAGQIQDATGVEVRYVLTAGAPVGDARIPAGTHTLHLEHQQDWVTGTDGTSNPDAPNRTTMTLTDPVQPPGTEEAGLGPAHKLPVYLAGAAAADASSDPSLRASVAGMGAVVGAGSVATRELYRFRRAEPRPATRTVPRGLPGPPKPPAPASGPVIPAVRRPLPFVQRRPVTGAEMPRPARN